MIADRPFLGIALMFGFCVLAPIADSIAKLIGDSVPLGQLIAVRFALQAALLLPIVIFTGRPLKMSARHFGLTALRTLLHIVGIGAMFLSLRYLPLADAVAIAFVMPFLLLLLGYFILGEEVGLRRMIACTIGFAGTLLVIQPSFAAVGAPALLPLLVALAFALFMLVTRTIAKATDPIAMQCVSGLMACIVLMPLLALSHGRGWTELDLMLPDAKNLGLLIALGVAGTAGHLLMTWSLRFAPSATLAPMQFLEIPFATVIGWIVFRDFPNGLALVGIAVTVASGLYVIARERGISRRPMPASTV